jgi:hypothetical protein
VAPTKHLDPNQAGAQITRDNEEWGSTLGIAFGPITFGFRSSAPTGSTTTTEHATFSQVNAAEMAVAETALRLWSNVAQITFTEVNAGGYTNSATILIGNYSNSSDGSAAYAYLPTPGQTSSTDSEGDVWINAYYHSNLSPAAGNYAYLTILHELGHSLGLEHPGDYNAGPGKTITYANSAVYVEDSRQYTVMSYFDAVETGANHVYQGQTIYASTPLLDDITAIQRLYGANTTFATGATTYGFNSNADAAYRIASSSQQVVYCIWDAGGTDTLDFSGYANNQAIDLRAGNFSDVGALTKNVSIALGVTIENALGGSGNDTMIGNDAGNLLVGGGGDDRITGGAGNDVLDGGMGFDTAVFSGTSSQYVIKLNGSEIDVTGLDSSAKLMNIEALQFADVIFKQSTASIAATIGAMAEGNSASTAYMFTVTLDGAGFGIQTVDWIVAGSGAHPADATDFGGPLPQSTLTFAAGETSKTILVNVSGDTTIEFDEGFTVALSNPLGGLLLGTVSANATILNDDKSVVSIVGQSGAQAEGNGVTTTYRYTVSLDKAGLTGQTVAWGLTGAGAQPANAEDFGGVLPAGTVTFAGGETSKTIVINVNGDETVEPDETFTVSLSGPSTGLTLGMSTAVSTILNDDASVSVATNSASQLEGNSGTTAFTFTLTLTGDNSVSHSVAYAVTGSGANPASAGDFAGGILPAGTVTFAAGESTKTIVVGVSGDPLVETDETFAVSLSGPSAGLTLGPATTSGTIRNDDASVSIAAVSAPLVEGDSGAKQFSFVLSLTGDSSVSHNVAFLVTGAGANPASGADFVGGVLPSGFVTFAVGETSKTIQISVTGDTVVEPDEAFAVSLSEPSVGLMLGTATAAGTILNDDASVSVATNSASQLEGNSGATEIIFTLILTGDSSVPHSVTYAVTGAGANSASSTDFAGGVLPSGAVTFAPGETSKTIVVGISGDTTVEPDETFTLTLVDPSSGPSVATGTIRNDDASVSVAALSANLAEGNFGATAFTFTLSQTGDTSVSRSLTYTVSGSGANPASASDFMGGVLPSGVVSFAAGEISKTILVAVSGDTAVEPSETFAVTISGTTAIGTIQNDDASVSIAALSATLPEGNSGTTVFTFALTLTGDNSVPHSVAYAVTGAGIHPASAADFIGGVLPSGILTFAVGETSQTLTVAVRGNTVVDFDEDFTVTLSNPSSGLVLNASTATGKIQNDDKSAVSIAALSADKSEGNGNATPYAFTVSLDQPGVTDQSVSWAVTGAGVDPASASDFEGAVLPSGVVTFVAGEISKTILVAVSGDTTIELDEAFALSLVGQSSGLILERATASGTIRNDDATVSIAAESANLAEGNSGVTVFAFTLTLTGDSLVTHTVAYGVTGTGTNPAVAADFQGGALPSGVVTFAAGETSKTVLISVSGDAAVEPDETFIIGLSGPSAGLTVATGTALDIIRNDDASVSIAASSPSLTEDDAGPTIFTFVLTLTGDSTVPHSIAYAAAGTGTHPASADDFAGGALPSGIVTFASGETSKSIVVAVSGDAAAEANEAFVVNLSGPSVGLSIGTASASATIMNDDLKVNDDAYVRLEGQALHVAAASGVLVNDDGTVPTTASLLTGPVHGTLGLASDGGFDYVPQAGFFGVDSFTYRASGADGADDGQVLIYQTPVSAGTPTTLDLLSLTTEEQIAATYVAFFARGADAAGFEFWLNEFHIGPPQQGAVTLFANIASAFAPQVETVALYPFMAHPQGASDAQVSAFLDSVYNNLFNRSGDALGLAYWTGQIQATIAAGQGIGSVLINIMSGAQNTPAGQDITTLMSKVAVGLAYVHEQQQLGAAWSDAADGANATALLQAVTSNPQTVLVGIAQAHNLVLADVH